MHDMSVIALSKSQMSGEGLGFRWRSLQTRYCHESCHHWREGGDEAAWLCGLDIVQLMIAIAIEITITTVTVVTRTIIIVTITITIRIK